MCFMRRSSALLVALVALGLMASSGLVRAQGYAVYEQSACMTGRGGAGVASPCADGSAVFFNPAGLSFDSTQLGLGATLISPRAEYTANATGNVSLLNVKWYPVPNLFFSKPVNKRVAIGMGIFAPYGLTTDWPADSMARFLGYKSMVQGVYMQPTVAFKVNDRLSIGGGVDITFENVELRQRLDLSSQIVPGTALTFRQVGVPAGTDFADMVVKGNAWHYGFHVGVLAKATDRLSFGLRYLKGQKGTVDDGTLEATQIPTGTRYDSTLAGLFTAGQKLASQAVKTAMPMPDQVVAGVAFQATSRVKVLLDYQFTRWSMFDSLALDGEGVDMAVDEAFRNTHGVRLGTEIAVSKRFVLRAGFDGHGPASPIDNVTPNLPEGTRLEFAGGATLRFSPNVSLDLGYLFMDGLARSGRTVPGTAANNDGVYKFTAHVPTAMLAVRF
jgi:long-chain fatty acid transport protein